MVSERPVVIFSKSSCIMSHTVKSLFNDFGVNPTVYELDEIARGPEIEQALSGLGYSTVPAVFIGGVKRINRVPSIKSKLKDTGKNNSPIKSKLNDTGKSNSPKSRWVPMSERVFSPQPVSQYNPITGEVRKEIEKSTVDNPKVSKVSDEPVVAAVESVVKESVKVPSGASKVENAPAEMLHDLDQQMEKKEDGGLYFIHRGWESIDRKCRCLVLWADVRENRLIGPELVQETTDKVILIKERLKAARDLQKSYANNRRKLLKFEVRDQVLLKESPWKGVKPINRVPSIKSKLKDTRKSNSPKSRWVPMSEKVFSPQPKSQYNPITGEVRKEIEKSAVDNPNVSKVSDEPVVAAVANVVKESVKVPSKVTSKVSDESVKESVMVPVVKKSVKASSVGVKPINRVHSIKSKLKDTGKSNSPKSRWVPMSERVFSPQPVSQYNPITGEVRKEIEKSAVDNPNVEPVVAAVANVVKESVKVSSKVTSKVSDESVKESVMVPVVKKSVKASSVGTDKLSSENQDKIDLVANKRSSLVAEKIDVVKDKVTSKVSDESVKESVMVPVVKKSVKASSVGTDKLSSENQDKIDLVANKRSSLVAEKIDVVKDKVDVVSDKASDALKNKLTGKGKKAVVSKDKDKPKNIASDVVKEKFMPNPKQKVISFEILVLRLSKQQENPEVKAKKDVSDSELDTDVVDYSFDEADRKRKKLKIKAGLKRKRSGSDSSNKNLMKIVQEKESEEDSIPKKGKKKEKQMTPKEAAHEEYLSSFPSFHARTTPSSFFSAIKNSRVDILRFLTDIRFSSLHNISIDHLPSKLGWFAMSKFKSYMLIFDSGDKIE
nr:monothiol glutaredoxin-S4-like [Tanacetum cinerariifolium]